MDYRGSPAAATAAAAPAYEVIVPWSKGWVMRNGSSSSSSSIISKRVWSSDLHVAPIGDDDDDDDDDIDIGCDDDNSIYTQRS